MNDYENEDNQSFSQELPSKIIVSSKLSKDEKNLSEEVKEWQEWKKLSLTEFKEFRMKWKISIKNSRKNPNSTTLYMKCQYLNCPIQYKTIIPKVKDSENEDKIIIMTKENHNHQIELLETFCPYGLYERAKEFMVPLVFNKVKPNKILKILEEYGKKKLLKKDELPTLSQVINFKKNYARNDFLLESEKDFRNLTDKYTITNAKDENNMFLIGYDLDPDDLCLVFSSVSLLQNVLNQAATSCVKYICTDSTYKLTLLGYPVIIIGTQDLDRKFRLIALAVSKHEREQDFKFMFSSLKSSLQQIFHYDWEIDYLMADGSQQIYKAARSIFGEDYVHGMCFVHVLRNLEKKIASYVKKEQRKELKDDIKFLENLAEKDAFDASL